MKCPACNIELTRKVYLDESTAGTYASKPQFWSGAYREAGDRNMYVFGVMKALAKVLHKSFCCTYACRQLHFSG